MKWQVIAPRTLHTRTWDNEVVVYDATTGNTHLLDAIAAQMLTTLTDAPADAAAITELLADLLPGGSAQLTHAQVNAILAELAGIALITPAAP